MAPGESDAQVLGVAPNATHAEVKTAWRAFALRTHPDLHPPGRKRDDAEESFKCAQNAYARLLAATPAAGQGEFSHATENTTASYTRRRRPIVGRSPGFGYGSLGYDQNAGTKIAVGLTVFAFFCVWASQAWSPQSSESRRKLQNRSTVSYGEQHAFWNAARSPKARPNR
jgi:curved DNA-binding protein CbpA